MGPTADPVQTPSHSIPSPTVAPPPSPKPPAPTAPGPADPIQTPAPSSPPDPQDPQATPQDPPAGNPSASQDAPAQTQIRDPEDPGASQAPPSNPQGPPAPSQVTPSQKPSPTGPAMIGTQTLKPGGSQITVSGTTYSLAPTDGSVIVGGQSGISTVPVTQVASPLPTKPPIVIGSQTLQLGAAPITVSGTVYYLNPSGDAVVIKGPNSISTVP